MKLGARTGSAEGKLYLGLMVRTYMADRLDKRLTIRGTAHTQANTRKTQAFSKRPTHSPSSALAPATLLGWEAWTLNHNLFPRLHSSRFHHTELRQDGSAFDCDYMVWKSIGYEGCPLQLGNSTFLHCEILFQI